MRRFSPALIFTVLLWFSASTRAAVIHDESVNGDLSGDRFNPTTYSLSFGVNSLHATTSGTDLEYVTLIVPPGYQLASIVVVSYVSANGIAFIGVQSGTTFTEDPINPNVANLLGWAHFGTDFGSVGQDILDDMGMGFGAIGFTPPLPAGPYTYWIQQFDFDPTTYQLDFSVALAPNAPGDLSHDGVVNGADVPLFVGVLLGLDHDPARVAAADVNHSGGIDGADIAPFIALLIP